jgi:hypothetical protein
MQLYGCHFRIKTNPTKKDTIQSTDISTAEKEPTDWREHATTLCRGYGLFCRYTDVCWLIQSNCIELQNINKYFNMCHAIFRSPVLKSPIKRILVDIAVSG